MATSFVSWGFVILGTLILLQGMAPTNKPHGTKARYSASAYKRQNNAKKNVKYKQRDFLGVIGSKENLKTAMLNVDGFSDTCIADVQDFVSQNSPDIVFFLKLRDDLKNLVKISLLMVMSILRSGDLMSLGINKEVVLLATRKSQMV